MTPKQIFIPFGELKPDLKELLNDGVTRAEAVVPHADTYVPTGAWANRTAANLAAEPFGLHTHASAGGWYGYFGTTTNLYELSNTTAANWTVTSKTRTVGGNYAAPATNSGWQGASFGEAVVMTNYTDDPQYLASPATANFAKLAQSGGGSPGMDPKAKFVAPIRNNLFLANLNLAAGFDGLALGANPIAVAWSQSDVPRQFGSTNETPQLIGAGYQPLNYDLGDITGLVGGQYGLVAMQRGWVRIDGPPYTFRPISQGIGCQFANSIVRFDDDVYFFGPSGPMVLRGGEGPVIPLGRNRIQRTVLDTAADSTTYANFTAAGSINLGAVADVVNRQVWWTFQKSSGLLSSFLIYDVDMDRFTVWPNPICTDDAQPCNFRFPRLRPDALGGWMPGRDIVALKQPPAGSWRPVTPTYDGATALTFEVGYRRYDPELTTRISRVRFAATGSTVGQAFAVRVYSKNAPWQAHAASPFQPTAFSTVDAHGWVVTPSAPLADMHRIEITFTSTDGVVDEIHGLEVEYIVGGTYSA